MPIFEFTAILDRVIVDDDYDRLFEAGLDDSSPGIENGQGYLMVSRDAESPGDAIVGVFQQARAAGFTVRGVRDEDLVSLKTLAGRLGRSYESLRLLSTGRRGPGGFPPPASTDGWALYSWASVTGWLAEHGYIDDAPADADHRALIAADHLLRARALVDSATLEHLVPLTAA